MSDGMTKKPESLHALYVRLCALERLIEERDRLYGERHDSSRQAIDAALIAIKDQTRASFAASEKAIEKAEDAQRDYNEQHNGLVRKMDDQYSHMIPRTEAANEFKNLSEKIEYLRRDVTKLRELSSRTGGKEVGASTLWGYIIGVVGIVAALIAVLT